MGLRRPTWTVPIPAGAEIVSVKGKPHARYRDDSGKLLTAPLTKKGDRIRLRSKQWYGFHRDRSGIVHKWELGTDREAAETLFNDKRKAVERGDADLVHPLEESRRRPLTEHADDFERYLLGKNNTPKHARQATNHVRAILKGCHFQVQADVSPSAVVAWLADERTAGRLSIRTTNYFLRDFKSFPTWMVRDVRADRNPLTHLSGLNADIEDGLERRTLPNEEFGRLVEAARTGPVVRRLSGHDRAILYTVAAFTGLREQELASLTTESFDLDADPPTVVVEAGYSKRRRRDILPIRPDMAERLRGWLDGREAGEKAWPGAWWRHGAKIVRHDLAAARAVWIAEAEGDAEETARRERTTVLCFEDAGGRRFDFHALRHQHISNLAAAGVHPKVAQELARHSDIRLTMDHYTHLGVSDLSAALDRLPDLP